MYSTWQSWCTPKFDEWTGAPEVEQMERDIIDPAIKAIESFAVGSYLAWRSSLLTPDPATIKNEAIPDGWDSTIRYNSRGVCGSGVLLEPVMRYIRDAGSDGIASAINPDYGLPGVIVFAHSNPFGGFISKVKRWLDDSRIHLEVTVTIPDESVFRTGWFRLQ